LDIWNKIFYQCEIKCSIKIKIIIIIQEIIIIIKTIYNYNKEIIIIIIKTIYNYNKEIIIINSVLQSYNVLCAVVSTSRLVERRYFSHVLRKLNVNRKMVH